ncbi:MAG: hypothetical protein HN348_16300, partial [Proteobacteria bacterium]|nr:hypothetical protein [Pseudomonadota bacterium]
MIQPPGATDWVYASEVAELKGVFPVPEDIESDEWRPKSNAAMYPVIVGVVLTGILIVAGIAIAVLFTQLPTGEETLLGDGGLSYSEMLTTEATEMLADPDSRSRTVSTLKKDQVLELMAKRDDFYRARTKGGAEGWVAYDAVVPMYQLGGAEVREEMDPLYNPDHYVDVENARWSQLPDQVEESITVFQFVLQNSSRYEMTDLILLATIKDDKGSVLEKVEIAIEGVIPTEGRTFVGTLAGEEKDDPKRSLTSHSLDLEAEVDPELQLRYSDGVEVKMTTLNFTEANIDILELRAIPE